MDVRDLTTLDDGTFDVAIDKGKGAFGLAWAVVSGLGLMTCAERYDGRDDDYQGRRVGEFSYHYPGHIASKFGTIPPLLTACTTGSSTTRDR